METDIVFSLSTARQQWLLAAIFLCFWSVFAAFAVWIVVNRADPKRPVSQRFRRKLGVAALIGCAFGIYRAHTGELREIHSFRCSDGYLTVTSVTRETRSLIDSVSYRTSKSQNKNRETFKLLFSMPSGEVSSPYLSARTHSEAAAALSRCGLAERR